VASLEEELQALVDDTDGRLGALGARYSRLKNLATAAKTASVAAGKDLLEAMEECGMTGLSVGSTRITIKTRRAWGVAESDDPDKHLANIQAVQDWVAANNPPQPDSKVATIKQTIDILRSKEGEDYPIPDFIVEHEIPQLSVRNS
jgi:hypothetical protein